MRINKIERTIMLNKKNLIKGSVVTGVVMAFWLSAKVSYYKGKVDSDQEWYNIFLKLLSGNIFSF